MRRSTLYHPTACHGTDALLCACVRACVRASVSVCPCAYGCAGRWFWLPACQNTWHESLSTICCILFVLLREQEAIENCDKVVEQRSTPVPGLFIDPRLVSEAYLGRAEVSMKDFDYDGAVSDYRTAINLVQGEAQHEVLI